MRSSIVALAVLLLPAVAQAQLTKDQINKAKKHYKAGVDAESKEEYDKAISEFTAAYDITKDAKVFFKIAESHEKAGRIDDAISWYTRYQKEAKLTPKGEEEVEAKIAELEKKRQAAMPPPPEEKPPEPTPPEEPVQPTLAPSPPPEPDDEPAGWYRTAAWVSVGLTAALLTTGGVLATSAAAREEDVERLTDFRDPLTGQPHRYQGAPAEQYVEAHDEGDDLDTYALATFIAAGVTAGLAVTFFVLDMSGGEQDAEESARIQPVVSPEGAGVSASFSF